MTLRRRLDRVLAGQAKGRDHQALRVVAAHHLVPLDVRRAARAAQRAHGQYRRAVEAECTRRWPHLAAWADRFDAAMAHGDGIPIHRFDWYVLPIPTPNAAFFVDAARAISAEDVDPTPDPVVVDAVAVARYNAHLAQHLTKRLADLERLADDLGVDNDDDEGGVT